MDKAGRKFNVPADPVGRSARGRSPAPPTRPAAPGPRVRPGRTRRRAEWASQGAGPEVCGETPRPMSAGRSGAGGTSLRRPGDRLPEKAPQALSHRTLRRRGASALKICPTRPGPSHAHWHSHTHEFAHAHTQSLTHAHTALRTATGSSDTVARTGLRAHTGPRTRTGLHTRLGPRTHSASRTHGPAQPLTGHREHIQVRSHAHGPSRARSLSVTRRPHIQTRPSRAHGPEPERRVALARTRETHTRAGPRT